MQILDFFRVPPRLTALLYSFSRQTQPWCAHRKK